MATDDTLKRFISTFNQIERFLTKACQFSTYKPFYQLVDKASETFPAVRQHAFDLREFADLRNAIMHGYNDNRPLATPHVEAVVELEKLRDLLMSPPKLGQKFRRTVYTCTPNDNLGKVVHVMFDKDYSQVPVYETGKFVGLLNTETVTRWLSTRFYENEGILEEEQVRRVLSYAPKGKRHEFLGERDDAFQALEAFDARYQAGSSLDAVLITANGSNTETPIGILTVFDIPRLRSLASMK
jgi:predicted transcriptional regulator